MVIFIFFKFLVFYQFYDFLKIKSHLELLQIIDVNNDGTLDEDEQVFIFSIIKIKMVTLAEKLCKL